MIKRILRGEVWLVSLDLTSGTEMRKKRPCVVVSSDRLGVLPLKIIVPITGWDKSFGNKQWLIEIEPNQCNGLSKRSVADSYQIRSVDVKRFDRKIGYVSVAELEDIVSAVGIVIEI